MPRAWIWLQVVLGWLPVWALYTALIAVVHGVPLIPAALLGLRAIAPAVLLGLVVHRLARRYPWPRPFRLRFAALHLVAAPLYAASWIAAVGVVESVVRRHLTIVVGPGLVPFAVLGIWLYVMVAGISYAIEATARAAHAEAAAARTQLGALRAQLQPHFLFNALHTVVQLIPVQPALAQDAAERVADLLRTTITEDRDLVTVADEWRFVSRYLDVERLRFGDRLLVRERIDPAALDAHLPSFTLQTLVENAVRHGVEPRIEPTTVSITVLAAHGRLTIEVVDDGDGASATAHPAGARTGLGRLRERLSALYGDRASLVAERAGARGWRAAVSLPAEGRARE